MKKNERRPDWVKKVPIQAPDVIIHIQKDPSGKLGWRVRSK